MLLAYYFLHALTTLTLHWVIRLREDAQQIVSQHIKLLHRYNEAKDAAQVACLYMRLRMAIMAN